MATIAHCLFAFEALAARLENRKSLTLEQVQKSYADYLKAVAAEEEATKAPGTAKQLPALRRLAGSSSSGSSSPSTTSSTTSLQQPAPGSGADTPNTSVSSLDEIAESPLFITWNIMSERYGYTLRGCIGTFEPLELEEGLSSYSLTAALHDTRFNPISLKELPELEVAVTLLTDFEDANDAMDWEIGTHGLRLSFYYHGRRYGSTYLPDVAPEQGWTKEETVVSLMRKAGWMGRKDKWQEVDLKVVRYQGKRESLEYEDYKAWKDWANKQ
ncbi:hypothetical protein GQ53DRAFT_243684 [Thozetella sp. PMI_491]|nr:hypothetical protein GQ53DRAFT_243684 [Thozetella sp. PMI_491]